VTEGGILAFVHPDTNLLKKLTPMKPSGSGKPELVAGGNRDASFGGFRHYHLGSCHLFCLSASTCYGPAALIERAEIVSSADRERSGYCLAGTVLGRRPPRRTVPRPGPGWLALPWLPAPTLRIHDAIFHRARLHHTGVLICRDFCPGLGRGRRWSGPMCRVSRCQPTGVQLQDRG